MKGILGCGGSFDGFFFGREVTARCFVNMFLVNLNGTVLWEF